MTEQVGDNAGPVNETQVAETTQVEAPKAEPNVETPEKTEVKSEVPQETVKEPKRNGFTRKIEKLERTIAELQQKIPQPQPTVTAEAAPKPDDFQTWDEYYEAKAAYVAKDLFRKEMEARESKSKEQSLREERERTLTDFQKKAREFAKTATDYDDVINGLDIDLSPALQAAVVETQNPALAYHLAQNPDLIEEINGKSYGEIARTLGRLEAKLESPKTEVKTTQAPPPIKPVGSNSKGSFDPYTSKGDDFEAYQRWRAQQTTQ